MNDIKFTVLVIVLLILGAVFGFAVTRTYYKKKLERVSKRWLNAINRENNLHADLQKAWAIMDILRMKHDGVSNKLLEELCEAVEGNYIDLPSFGIVDISTPNGLKNAFQKAMETDTFIANGIKLIHVDTNREGTANAAVDGCSCNDCC